MKDMKEFNLEAAKAGAKVCTRDGREVRIICFDAKSEYPILALIMCGDGKEYLYTYAIDGYAIDVAGFTADLFMSPTKHEGWVNIYREYGLYVLGIYETEAMAKQEIIPSGYVATAKIEWEE